MCYLPRCFVIRRLHKKINDSSRSCLTIRNENLIPGAGMISRLRAKKRMSKDFSQNTSDVIDITRVTPIRGKRKSYRFERTYIHAYIRFARHLRLQSNNFVVSRGDIAIMLNMSYIGRSAKCNCEERTSDSFSFLARVRFS